MSKELTKTRPTDLIASAKSAESWLDEAASAMHGVLAAVQTTKERIFTVGRCVSKAGAQIHDGDWEDFLGAWITSHTPKGVNGKPGVALFTTRSARNYKLFYETQMALAQKANPRASEAELEKIAIQSALDTPGGYVQCLIAAGAIRDPNGYNKDRYEQKKNKTTGQTEFDFSKFKVSLELLSSCSLRFDDTKVEELDASIAATKKILGELEAQKQKITSTIDVSSQSAPAPESPNLLSTKGRSISSGRIALSTMGDTKEWWAYEVATGFNAGQVFVQLADKNTCDDIKNLMEDDEIGWVLRSFRASNEAAALEFASHTRNTGGGELTPHGQQLVVAKSQTEGAKIPFNNARYYGQCYTWNGAVVGVVKQDDQWIVANLGDADVITPITTAQLPPCDTAEECQEALDGVAAIRNLQAVTATTEE
jgi:hypothetical protein